MILLVAGMRRSGSTVAFQIAMDLVGGKESSLGYTDINNWTPDIIMDERWYVAKTHRYLAHLQHYIDAGKIKVLNTYRDPRDICVSIMNLKSYDFEQAIETGFVQMAVVEQEKWERHASSNRAEARYENFYRDLPHLIRLIGYLLDEEIDPRVVSILAQKFSLKENKRKADNARNMRPDFLFHGHIQDGSVGQWKDRLNHEQQTKIFSFAGEWMHTHDYTAWRPHEGNDSTDNQEAENHSRIQ
jgi:hypothetical protein